ncbi:hypothetical protein MLD38_028151 [Melastoma candidum]|uniref:Uncharacterized protein n=1 Tax=Melastoma candidum TaxID=119954 RepID=A0ACB9N4F3_9MYRT|nr:hypothetical protein MLD38_028151 [Melastoma candidum]
MGFHNHAMVAALVVVISALSLAPGSAAVLPRKIKQPGNLIEQICRKTDYVNVCIASVTGNLKGKARGISILNAEIDACAEGTRAALAQVAKLSKSASKEEKQALSSCKESFGSAINSLTNAKKAIKARDIGTLDSELSAVITFVSNCNDAYGDVTGPSPLAKVDNQLIHLGSNCLAIAEQIRL